MKIKILLISVIALFTSFIQAQHIQLAEEDVTINKQFVPAWTAIISEDPDFVKKSFTQFCKDNYNVTPKKKGKQAMLIEEAMIPLISQNKGDLWMVFQSTENTVKICLSYFMGYDIVINSYEYPEEMAGLKSFMTDFIVFYKTDYFTNLIEENTSRLDNLTKDLKKAEKEVNDLSKQVAKTEKSLLKGKDESKAFELNNKNIENKARIAATTEVVENLKNEISYVSQNIKQLNDDLARLNMEAVEIL